MRKGCFLFFILITALLSSQLSAQGVKRDKELPTLIVFDLTPEKGVEKGTCNLLTEFILSKVSELKRYEVIGQKDIDKMLFWESNKQLKNCTESSCLVQIAGAMGASYYVEGSLGNVGAKYVINLKLMDAEKAKVIKRKTLLVNKDEDSLLNGVIEIVGEIFGEEKKEEAKKPEEGKKEEKKVGEKKEDKKEEKKVASVDNKEKDVSLKREVVAYEKGGKSLAYISGGAGLLFTGAGVVFMVLANNIASDYKDGKYTEQSDIDSKRSKFNLYSGLGIGGISLGLIGIGASVYLFLGDKGDSKGALMVSPDAIAINFRW